MEEKPTNIGEVAAKHVDGILNVVDQARRESKSDLDDVKEALRNYEKTLRGSNTTLQASKVTLSVFELEDNPPKVDVSAFTLEGQAKLKVDEDTISAGMSYLYPMSVWLGKEMKDSDVIRNVSVGSVQAYQQQGTVIHDIKPQGWLEKAKDFWHLDRPLHKANQKTTGIMEARFGRIEFAQNRWDVYCKQFHNKFVPMMTELGRTDNQIAMYFVLQTCIRNFLDVSRIILSVLPVGYQLEYDKRLNTLAQAATNLTSAQMAAQANAQGGQPGQQPTVRLDNMNM